MNEFPKYSIYRMLSFYLKKNNKLKIFKNKKIEKLIISNKNIP